MNYLYNGVLFPKVPEVEGHPYSLVNRSTSGGETYAHFYAATTPVFYNRNTGSVLNPLCVQNDGTVVHYGMNSKDGETEWVFRDTKDLVSGDSFAGVGIVNYLIWSNHDIFNEDGTLYLAASDPIPVNPPNPTAMMMGYMVGQAIRK